MGQEAKEKRFVKIIIDVDHKMGAKWDDKLSREAVFEPRRQPLTKKGPTKGKAAPLESIRRVLERCLVEIVADWSHKIGARRVTKWSLFEGLGKCENSAPIWTRAQFNPPDVSQRACKKRWQFGTRRKRIAETLKKVSWGPEGRLGGA